MWGPVRCSGSSDAPTPRPGTGKARRRIISAWDGPERTLAFQKIGHFMDRLFTGVGSDLYRAIGICLIVGMVLFEEGIAFFGRKEGKGLSLPRIPMAFYDFLQFLEIIH
jgi:hypothetical protein